MDTHEIERRRCRRLYLRMKRLTPKQRKRAAERANRVLNVYSRISLHG